MARLDYRRRAFYYLAQANAAADPERRVELLLLARMWMELFEPPEDIPGHFELPKHKPDEA